MEGSGRGRWVPAYLLLGHCKTCDEYGRGNVRGLEFESCFLLTIPVPISRRRICDHELRGRCKCDQASKILGPVFRSWPSSLSHPWSHANHPQKPTRHQHRKSYPTPTLLCLPVHKFLEFFAYCIKSSLGPSRTSRSQTRLPGP